MSHFCRMSLNLFRAGSNTCGSFGGCSIRASARCLATAAPLLQQLEGRSLKPHLAKQLAKDSDSLCFQTLRIRSSAQLLCAAAIQRKGSASLQMPGATMACFGFCSWTHFLHRTSSELSFRRTMARDCLLLAAAEQYAALLGQAAVRLLLHSGSSHAAFVAKGQHLRCKLQPLT